MMRYVISYIPKWDKNICLEKVVFANTCEEAFEKAESTFDDLYEIIGLS